MGLNGQIVNQVRYVIDANGRIIGYRNPVTDADVDEASLTASQVAAVAAQVPFVQSVGAPWRIATLGDSRANYHVAGTQIGLAGNGASYNSARVPTMLCAYMQDAMLVANFGVSGDTLISSSSSTGWDGRARANSKTFKNLLALQPDAVYIQYGINDLPAATSANLIAEAKQLVSALVAAGIKVCLSNIMTFDPTSASPNITPANAATTLVKINEFRDAMSAWIGNFAGRAVWCDPNPDITLASTGYGDPQYFLADTLGVHPSDLGSQVMGRNAAIAMRTLLPQRNAKAWTLGPLYQPNFIDWAATASSNVLAQNSLQGTSSASATSWGIDSTTGIPYAECTFTVSALNGSNYAQFFLKCDATGVSGATPTFALDIGDAIQGSARITVDDGAGNRAAGLQRVVCRVRQYNTGPTSQFFVDWGGLAGAAAASLPLAFDALVFTPVYPSPIASATLDTAGTASQNRGFYIGAIVEVNAVGTYRVRFYGPSLRVVTRPIPVAVTAGASPYVFQNSPQAFVLNDFVNGGQDMQVSVSPGAGGSISAITLFRGPTVSSVPLGAVDTKLTSGTFILKPGDGLVVTWAVTAAVLVYSYI